MGSGALEGMSRLSRYAAYRSRGLCGDCGRKALPNRSRCVRCRKDYRARDAERKKKGLCVTCGDAVEAGKGQCRSCLDRYNKHCVRRMKALRKCGLCIKCGLRRRCKRSKSRCATCLRKARNSESRRSPIRLEKNARWRAALKREVFEAYGGFSCSCCGEKERKFLCLDHVKNDGAKHRKKIGEGGDRILRWLKKNGFPKGFQVICANCNQGKHLNGGVCPHREGRG